jgi:WD40 repeat protein
MRLRPAFSLRSLLLAITLAACALGYRVMPEPWQLRFKKDIEVSDVAISADGELLATGENDGPRISVWQASTGKELFRLVFDHRRR